MGGFEVDLGLFHQFEEVALDAGAGDIGSDAVARRGDFIDLVEVDDAIFRQIEIPVGFADQIANQFLDITADIAGLAELGGIAFDERDTDLFGDQFDQIGLADTGGPDHQHIAFDIADQLTQSVDAGFQFHAVEVGADLGGEHLNGLSLPHDKLPQILFQLGGFEVEIDQAIKAFFFGFRRRSLAVQVGIGRNDHPVAVLFLEELVDIPAQLIRRGIFRI